VGVLSNNDGCFVSLTRELKDLGVKMGEPYFQVKKVCQKNKVAVFSSNFSLYTNVSDRVMTTLSQFSPEVEVYSVDEAFMNLTGFDDIERRARLIKQAVEDHVGIPVGVGVGPTKTLAKIANHLAKKKKETGGVVVLLDPEEQTRALRQVAVDDIWGVGRQYAIKLKNMGLNNALQFRDYPHDKHIKKLFTKVGLQMQEELKGYPRFELELATKKKKNILCSRSFSEEVKSIEALREAVAHYASQAAEKIRKQESVCTRVGVFARTSPFRKGPQHRGYETVLMLSPSSDTRKIIRYAFEALDQLFKAGYEYKKAGVTLSELYDQSHSQLSLFENSLDPKGEALMRAMDAINKKEGPGTLRVAACGNTRKAWSMNRNFLSPRYVTGWGQLPRVR
jgi:DNA polymerase V